MNNDIIMCMYNTCMPDKIERSQYISNKKLKYLQS